MSSESIPESTPCLSKTGPDTRQTGKTSAAPSVNAPAIVVKEAPPIPTAAPETANLTPSPEAGSSLPLLILTTNPATVTPAISEPGASAAIPLMTPDITPEPDDADLALSATTDSPRSLTGKKPNPSAKRSQELQRSLRNDETQTTLYQIQLENYKPFTARIQASIDIWGSSAKFAGGEYAVRAKQIAAACQVSGLNDPNATPAQRLAIATSLHKGTETYDRAFEQGLDKTEWKDQFKKTIDQVSEFFGLGNKKAVSARNKAQRKAA